MLYRLFKLPANVDRTTSQVIYNGSVTGNEEELKVRNTAQLHENVVSLSLAVFEVPWSRPSVELNVVKMKSADFDCGKVTYRSGIKRTSPGAVCYIFALRPTPKLFTSHFLTSVRQSLALHLLLDLLNSLYLVQTHDKSSSTFRSRDIVCYSKRWNTK